MAGKTRKKPAPWTVEKIKAGLIVNRLQNHIFAEPTVVLKLPAGEDHPASCHTVDNPKLMSQSQVTAALGLLKKVHPDLQSQKVEVIEPVRVEVVRVAHKASK